MVQKDQEFADNQFRVPYLIPVYFSGLHSHSWGALSVCLIFLLANTPKYLCE